MFLTRKCQNNTVKLSSRTFRAENCSANVVYIDSEFVREYGRLFDRVKDFKRTVAKPFSHWPIQESMKVDRLANPK